MGFRLSKRVSLGKGVGLNTGKRKVSLSHRSRHGSVGTSGFSLSVPGSAVSYRSKWASKKRRSKRNGGSFLFALILIGAVVWALPAVYGTIVAILAACIIPVIALCCIGTYSERDISTVAGSASRLVDIVNESKELARSAKNPATRMSRLQVAKDNLARLKEMTGKYRFLKLASLEQTEQELDEIAAELEQTGYGEAAEGNERGQRLEKEGDIDGAIEVYEKLAARGVDTPFCYRRLAILYRKKGMPSDELRVLRRAIECIPMTNAQHFGWFEDRYKKVLMKLSKA